MNSYDNGEGSFALLPQKIFRMILQYLSRRHLRKMDMAIINHSLRPHYLSAIDGMLISSFKEFYFLGNWIMSRNLKPRNITCEYETMQPIGNPIPLLLNSREHLEILSLHGIPDNDFRQFGSFPALTDITFWGLESPLVTLVNFWNLNPQLKKISLHFTEGFNVEYVTSLISKCPNLKHLDLSHNKGFNDACAVKLVQGGLDLYSLRIDGTSVRQRESLDLILNSFPNLHYFTFPECGFSTEIGEFILRQIAIPALLSDDPEIQSMGFYSVDHHFEILHSSECYDFQIDDEIFSSIVWALIPMLQQSSKDVRRKALGLLQIVSSIIVRNNYLPKLFDYAIQHPEVLEPCDVLQKIAEHDYSRTPQHNQILYLFEPYNSFFISHREDDGNGGEDYYDGDYYDGRDHEAHAKKPEIGVTSLYEDEDSLELVSRPNLLQSEETHFFFLNLVEACLLFDQMTVLDYVAKSGMISLCGTIVNKKADMSSEWRVNLSRKLRYVWPWYLKQLDTGLPEESVQEDSKSAATRTGGANGKTKPAKKKRRN